MLVRPRLSRAAANMSSALNSGGTRMLIETVFSAATFVSFCIDFYHTKVRLAKRLVSGSHR